MLDEYHSAMAVRSEASRKAILDATMTLLDGTADREPLSLQKLSIDAIARHAGVSKMTIYRWWPTKAAVVIDSFVDSHLERTPVRDTGPGIDALREHLTLLMRAYSGPDGRLVAQLVAEAQYDATTMKVFKERFWQDRVVATRKLIARAMEEGALRSDLDPDLVAETLYAPIFFKLLFKTDDAGTVADMLDSVMTGFAPPSVD